MGKQDNQLYEFGPFRVDPRECQVLRAGEAVSLTPKAFETLLVLIQNQGHLLLKDELLKTLWPDSFVEEVNLSQNISTLRKALGDTAQGSRYIVTVPGKGYRFVGEVKTLSSQVAKEPDDLVVESRSRSRVVIEEQTVEEDLEPHPRVLTIEAPEPKALPGEVAAIHRRWRWILICSV